MSLQRKLNNCQEQKVFRKLWRTSTNFLALYNCSIISNGAKCYGVKCPWGEMSVGRNIRGAKCPWTEKKLSWGELSMRHIVHRAKCPWGDVPGAISLGRVVHGAKCHRVSFDGVSCPWGRVSIRRVVRESCGWFVEEKFGRLILLALFLLSKLSLSLKIQQQSTS